MDHVVNGYYRDLSLVPAQCKARCIKEFSIKLHQLRSQCVESCEKAPNYCTNECKNGDVGCKMGCEYLSNILREHGGSCPVYRGSDDKPRSCLIKCKSDSDCYSSLNKCCQIGCSFMCVKPEYNSSIPKLAPKLIPTQTSNYIDFEWMSHYQDFIRRKEPIIFILQTRVCPCKVFNEAYAQDWQNLITTAQSGAKLEKFDPGKIYQFRLAAVSRFGTHGYGPPSDTFPRVVTEPEPPEPPRKLRETMTRVYSSGDISVTIEWEKPRSHSLPISEYLVKWVVDHGYIQPDGQAMLALTSLSYLIPADRQKYVLEKLKPNTSYRVELYTKIYWPGGEPLISEAASLFIKTPAINQKTIPDYSQPPPNQCTSNTTMKWNGLDFATLSPAVYSTDGIRVNLIIHHTKLQKYKITWTPVVCIDMNHDQTSDSYKSHVIQSKNTFFQLSNLQYNCRYELEVEKLKTRKSSRFHQSSFMDKMKENKVIGYFCVPGCEVLRGTNCESRSTISNPPPVPHSLVTNPLSNDFLSYELTWKQPSSLPLSIISMTTSSDPSSSANSNYYSIKYRISWGPRVNEPIRMKFYNEISGLSPIRDNSKTTVKVVDMKQNQLVLKNLQPQTMYIIEAKLLVFSRDGHEMESEAVYHYFFTGQENLQYQEDLLSNSSSKFKFRYLECFLLTLFISLVLS